MTEEKIVNDHEVKEMFDEKFLPNLQLFAQRLKEQQYPEEEVAFYQATMILQFSDLENPLKHENIMKEGRINFNLQAITKKDMQEHEEPKNVEENS